MGHPSFLGGSEKEQRSVLFTSHPSQKREGWGTRAFGVCLKKNGGPSGLRPTLSKSAKDGAPERLGCV